MRADRFRVLLLWPGGLFGTGGGNFGVPQLLTIASELRRRADAICDVVDLDLERAFGPIDLTRIAAPNYDLIGISCYSSFDYLGVMELAAKLRMLSPRASLVAGGYHPSARPEDFTQPGSPFDYVIVGDGELPMIDLAASLARGGRPLMRVLGPRSIHDVNDLEPYDWSLLERYRPVASRVAKQAEIYLSRGCPYDCAFCMERAKRDVSWRALDPQRAVEEMHRLDRFLDLSGWTVFIADALFGMKKTWRREFLELLARKPIRARKIWVLIRLDLVEREDVTLMAAANVAPGFGLETGDPEHVKRIRKVGALSDYLQHMHQVSEWARELDVPFGANVIVGHPGETRATLERTRDYLEQLFLHAPSTTGFLSVDPFRMYPGSPIDEERERWTSETGMKLHRYPWWNDGDQEFLAEWVDPSRELDYRTTFELRRAWIDPIVRELPKRFAYRGPARDYFQRAIDDHLEQTEPAANARKLSMLHLWSELTRKPGRTPLAEDLGLAEIMREARAHSVEGCGEELSAEMRRALIEVPRERFVSLEDVAESFYDLALPLDELGQSTISALHAYARMFRALELGPGDDFVDLGGGTGYGAALAMRLVGSTGRVRAIEMDPRLVERSKRNLDCVVEGDAHDVSLWRGASKVAVSFALAMLPPEWIAALADRARLVAPIERDGGQMLTLFEKNGAELKLTKLGLVRFVSDRSAHAR